MKALQFVGWLVLFLCLYVAFFILFQHGPNFSTGAKELPGQLLKLMGSGK